MPKILTLTLFHLVVAVATGLVLGMGVLGVGFSDSALAKSAYTILVYAWQVLNAPAGVYFFHAQPPNLALFGGLQLITSFLWANVIAMSVARWKAYRHNQSLHRTPKRLPPFWRR